MPCTRYAILEIKPSYYPKDKRPSCVQVEYHIFESIAQRQAFADAVGYDHHKYFYPVPGFVSPATFRQSIGKGVVSHLPKPTIIDHLKIVDSRLLAVG